MAPMALAQLPLLLLARPATADWRSVVFDTPTAEPGLNQAKQPIISGGMPIGNGETTALVFPVTKGFAPTSEFELQAGVHVWLGMTTAMASDMAPMSLGVVRQLNPNPNPNPNPTPSPSP